MKGYLFFDLDGTISNSAEGILNAVTYAIRKMGLPMQDRRELLHYIGPPLIRSFSADYGLDHAQALEAVSAYREYYSDRGIFECALYDGVTELLDAMCAQDYGLVLATCKPTVMARRMLEHFGIADRFLFLSGPELDGTRNEKHEVIAYAIEELGLHRTDAVLMIGDRRDDVLGARRNGIDCAGVLWGFGTETELKDAGARYLFRTPQHAADRIDPIFRERFAHPSSNS